MLIHKGYRFRIYPSEDQVARIRRWEGALRFLWNLALEQRLLGLARTDKRYLTAFDQINDLTDLRDETDWLADVPRNVCAQLLVELDKSWQRCFKKLARKPRWKRRGKDFLALTEPHPKVWRLDGDILRFPKLGNIRIVAHRPLEGTPKSCTVRRDGDQWFASIMCEVEVADPIPNKLPPIGIDMGVVNLMACSDGTIIDNPQHLKHAQARLARAQRRVARRKKGSRNQDRAKARVARIHRKIRRQREHVLHVATSRIAKSHGHVFVEDLKIRNMTASASGTLEDPGTNVSIKSSQNRDILDSGWGEARWMLGYKTVWHGGSLDPVVAAGSSQTCSECGHRDALSRASRDWFCCTACGHAECADVNAAKVILQRGLAAETAAAGCGGSAAGRPKKQQLRVVRRGQRSGQARAPLLPSDNAPTFRSG